MKPFTRVRLDRALAAAGIPIHGTSGAVGAVVVSFRDEATQQQRASAQAIVAAFDESPEADAAFVAAQSRSRAEEILRSGALGSEPTSQVFRALALLVLERTNATNERANLAFDALKAANETINALGLAIQQASSLTDLKARAPKVALPVMVPPPLADKVNPAQLIEAMVEKLAAGQ